MNAAPERLSPPDYFARATPTELEMWAGWCEHTRVELQYRRNRATTEDERLELDIALANVRAWGEEIACQQLINRMNREPQ